MDERAKFDIGRAMHRYGHLADAIRQQIVAAFHTHYGETVVLQAFDDFSAVHCVMVYHKCQVKLGTQSSRAGQSHEILIFYIYQYVIFGVLCPNQLNLN